jgi:peptidoglycan/LPS O-acetylase OafA/YrhL
VTNRFRPQDALPLACVAAAAMLAASELMTLFELTPPGGEAIQAVDAADRHGYSLLVLGVFAIAAVIVALRTGARVAALAVAVAGTLALLIFLVVDLPDVNQVGTLDDARQSFIDARAEPQAGFWLELVGALGLALSGAALTTLEPEQLQRRRAAKPRRKRAVSYQR